MKRLTVVYEKDETGWWYAKVKGVPGCHTQGRTIAEARRRIREPIALVLGDEVAEAAELVDDVRLPSQAAKFLRAARQAKRRAETEQSRAQSATVIAARKLVADAHLSNTDVGELLGLSRQRIQQISAKKR